MPSKSKLLNPVIRRGRVWKIEYYLDVNGQTKRVRKSRDDRGRDLNSISDLREREAAAAELLRAIRAKVVPRDSEPGAVAFVEALAIAVDLKRSDKWKTNKSFAENARWLTEFFQSKGWGSMPCALVTFEHIQAYFDHLLLKRRRVTNSTYNSRRNNLRAIFSELVARHYLPANFVKEIKPRPKTDPVRRPLTDQEAAVIVAHIRKDRALWLAYLLLGWLAIRPGEIRDLKVGQLDLRRGVVTFPGSQSKNRRNSVVTIPADLISEFEAFELEKYPPAYYLFGGAKGRHNSEFLPGPVQIGVNSLSTKFRTLIRRLKKAGALQDITGLQFYSLKDTLAVYLLDNGVPIESAMMHFRHRSLEMFQRYVKRLGVVDPNLRALEVKFPGKK